MKLINYFSLFLLFVFGPCWAGSDSLDVPADIDSGALYPLNLDVVTGSSEGAPFISTASVVQNPLMESILADQNELENALFDASYSRGLGSPPNTCPQGFDEVLGICAEICPSGYTAAVGACWQNCPSGWADMGLFCAKWFMKFSDKDIFGQKFAATSCAEGLVKEAGLCYQPCESNFTGNGPICSANLNNSNTSTVLNSQVSSQQNKAILNASTGGVELPNGVAPELRATVMFAPVACELDSIIGTLGFIPEDPIGAIDDSVNNAIQDAMGEWGNPVTNTAWYIPSIANTVLFDLSADAVCEDDGQIAQAHLTIEPSITVQVQSRIFDTALHNLSGFDVGIMGLSIYELIPFRIYGTVGATMSVPTELTSVIDRSLPPLLIDGQQYANKTALIVDPSFELWLSSEAYLRITSVVSFIPDILQLGAEFNLDVLNVNMPYIKEEGLRSNVSGYEIYREESLISELSSGSGSLDAFLRILGIDAGIFGDSGQLTWEGYTRYDELIYNASSTNIPM